MHTSLPNESDLAAARHTNDATWAVEARRCLVLIMEEASGVAEKVTEMTTLRSCMRSAVASGECQIWSAEGTHPQPFLAPALEHR